MFQVTPQKHSIYREEAVDSIAVALKSSLTNEKIRNNCCKALLILGGKFSLSGELLTESWCLRQAGFYDQDSKTNSLGNVEDCLSIDKTIPLVCPLNFERIYLHLLYQLPLQVRRHDYFV